MNEDLKLKNMSKEDRDAILEGFTLEKLEVYEMVIAALHLLALDCVAEDNERGAEALSAAAETFATAVTEVKEYKESISEEA